MQKKQGVSVEQASSLFNLIAAEVLSIYDAVHDSISVDVYEKSPNEYVTETDYLIEQKISELISNAFPHHSIIGEETGRHTSSSDYSWYIDPIDGTNNFMRHRPEYATSVGVTCKDKPIAGLIVYPVENMYIFGNTENKKVHVFQNGKPRKLGDTTRRHLFVGLPSNGLRRLNIQTLLDRDDVAFRASGAIGYDLGKMCLGQLDIRYGGNFKTEDIVAGIALLEASGGLALTNEGTPWVLNSQSLIAIREVALKDTALSGGSFQ
ncbi:MAG: inositol monophosphatase [Bacteroidota bacterium]